MLFHYKNEKGEIERFRMPEDFLLDFDDFMTDIYKRPANGILLDKIKRENIFSKFLNLIRI